MREMFTINEASKMTKDELNARLVSCRDELEALGMGHVDATRFVSEIMNIGISMQCDVRVKS